MTDSETPEEKNWLSTIAKGGLPQLLAGPAGKAISRLVGAGVEIPAAYLEGMVQGIRDKSDARSQISQAIAKQAAAMAVDDPEVMERAMTNMIARSYRSQKNKDAVAAVAMEDLNSAPPAPESEGPSDDWLTKFERYAEDASNDDLRAMFGKMLAGEIRRPGAVSAISLHFVSMLDSETAKLIERVLPICVQGSGASSNSLALLEYMKPALTVAEIAYIEQSGFWSPEKSITIQLDNTGLGFKIFQIDGFGVCLRGKANSEFRIQAAILSRAGRDLKGVVGRKFDFQAFADVALTKANISNVYFGKVQINDTNVSIPHATELTKNDVSGEMPNQVS